MKRYDYIQFGALSILSHIAQGAAFILLFAGVRRHGDDLVLYVCHARRLTLGVAYVSALSFLFGWGLRPDRGIDKNRCWNAAIVLYVLNLASLLVMPVPFGSGSILAMIWELPMAPAMVGINGVSGEGTMFSYVLFALLAAVEPLCFTLGLTRKGKKAAKSEDNENSAAFSADAEAAITNEENNTNA